MSDLKAKAADPTTTTLGTNTAGILRPKNSIGETGLNNSNVESATPKIVKFKEMIRCVL